MLDLRKKDFNRFFSKFVQTEGCWNWLDKLNDNGYGRFYLKGRIYRAHVVSYLIFIGEVPEGKIVHHECENRACVNPEHLKREYKRRRNAGLLKN